MGEKNTTFTIKLNDEYDAVVDVENQTIKVGCQEFNLNIINEIKDKIKSLNHD